MWLKKIKKRKLQSIMIFLMVLISTSLMAGSLSILTGLSKPFEDLKEETNSPDIKVYPSFEVDATETDWINKLNTLSGIDNILKINRYYTDELVMFDGAKTVGFCSITEYNEQQYSDIRILEGSIDTLDDGECFIPSEFANQNNINLNDRVTIYNGAESDTYQVKAIFVDPYSLNSAFQLEILINNIPDSHLIEPYYSIYLEEDYTSTDIINEYLQKNNGVMDVSFTPIEDSMANASLTESILGAILSVLSVIILIVCSVMIKYMIRNALLQDKKTLAIYKSIGYTNKNIITIYLKTYLFLSLLGSIIGVMVSPVISGSFIKTTCQNLGLQKMTVNYTVTFACVIFVNLIVFAQSYHELNKVKKIKPILLLNGKEQTLGTRKKKSLPSSSNMSFSPISMALRMMRRDKKNTIMIIVTCFLSIYMINMGVACFANIDSMSKDNYYWLGFDKYDISIESSGNQERFNEICDELNENASVKQLVRTNTDMGFCIPWAQSGTAMVYETYEGLDMPVIEGRNPRYSNEITIGNAYAKELNKEIGDYIDVYLDSTTKKSMLIVGTYQGFWNLGKGVRMLGNTLEENNISYNYVSASVYLNDESDIDDFINETRSQYRDDIIIEVRENMYASVLSSICDPQTAALGPFIAFVILIGSLNLIYIIYFKNIDNKKKYSIYKSIGYSSGHLVKMNLYYVGIIAVLSMLIAIPLFIFLFPITMTLAMSSFGFAEYPVNYNVLATVLSNIGLLIIFIVSALISSSTLYKNRITELIED